MKPWPFFGALILPALVAVSLMEGGWWWAAVLAVPFVVVPVLDVLIGPDHTQPTRSQMADLDGKLSYRLVLYLYAAAHVGLLIWGCYVWANTPLPMWERWLLVLCMGIMTGGLGITIAHELVHRRSAVERYLGYLLLCGVWYMHFGLEHVAGHHRNVGLPTDPATARRGESAYAFVIRSAVMGWVHAFNLERDRLRKIGRTAWTLRNATVSWLLIQVGWTVLAAVATGDPSVVVFILGQSAVAVLLLELVNYVEHYGLRRGETSPGIVERFGPMHAWESRYPASNYLLFKLQRHADHHLYPQRRYQLLGVHEQSPQLPAGYPLMVLAALVPPFWRRLVHPRLPG